MKEAFVALHDNSASFIGPTNVQVAPASQNTRYQGRLIGLDDVAKGRTPKTDSLYNVTEIEPLITAFNCSFMKQVMKQERCSFNAIGQVQNK